MWLTKSSIGRKVIMSVTGLALILFLTFHASMNVVALLSKDGYNMICEFLGANWYAVVATLGLAFLCVLHIVYAFILTFQNRKARGNSRYAVTEKPEKVEWASQNMLVLGIIVLLGVLLHLFNFWYNMMFAEILGTEGLKYSPADGFGWIQETFSCWVYVVLYIIWLVAIWFHLTHGFWSALQTFGWSGHVWFKRWRCIGTAYVTIVMLMFAAVPVMFFTNTAPSLCCKGQPTECAMHQDAACDQPCGGHACDQAMGCDQAKACGHDCNQAKGCEQDKGCARHCDEATTCEQAEGCKCGEGCKCDCGERCNCTEGCACSDGAECQCGEGCKCKE